MSFHAPGRSGYDARRKQIIESNAAEHFGSDAIGDTVDNLRAVLRRIDVRAKRPLAMGHADDPDDHLSAGEPEWVK
jgi:hypothetical protein